MERPDDQNPANEGPSGTHRSDDDTTQFDSWREANPGRNRTQHPGDETEILPSTAAQSHRYENQWSAAPSEDDATQSGQVSSNVWASERPIYYTPAADRTPRSKAAAPAGADDPTSVRASGPREPSATASATRASSSRGNQRIAMAVGAAAMALVAVLIWGGFKLFGHHGSGSKPAPTVSTASSSAPTSSSSTTSSPTSTATATESAPETAQSTDGGGVPAPAPTHRHHSTHSSATSSTDDTTTDSTSTSTTSSSTPPPSTSTSKSTVPPPPSPSSPADPSPGGGSTP